MASRLSCFAPNPAPISVLRDAPGCRAAVQEEAPAAAADAGLGEQSHRHEAQERRHRVAVHHPRPDDHRPDAGPLALHLLDPLGMHVLAPPPAVLGRPAGGQAPGTRVEVPPLVERRAGCNQVHRGRVHRPHEVRIVAVAGGAALPARLRLCRFPVRRFPRLLPRGLLPVRSPRPPWPFAVSPPRRLPPVRPYFGWTGPWGCAGLTSLASLPLTASLPRVRARRAALLLLAALGLSAGVLHSHSVRAPTRDSGIGPPSAGLVQAAVAITLMPSADAPTLDPRPPRGLAAHSGGR